MQTYRYVWANLDIDLINIGNSLFDDFQPVAKLFLRLKFEKEMQSESFYHGEVEGVRHFVNAKEIHIVVLDGLFACVGATEEHYWPCGEENVFYIDPDNRERVFRGPDGEDEIDTLYGPKEGMSN
jgi:hypothetical protein